MKIALVDDEDYYLDEMARLCHDFGKRFNCRIETVSFVSGESFLKAFNDGGFSIVFMDIYMEGIDGVAAAMKMREQDSGCILIFLTSSTEFMPDAFSCHAFEYIIKPFVPQRIFQVLADAQKILPTLHKYIEIYSERKHIRIFLDDIISIITDGHYLNIKLTDQTSVRCRMTMKEFIGCTDGDDRFIYANKGITLNADYIVDFKDNCCIMEDGTRLPIRVRERLQIEQAIQDYNFDKIRRRQCRYTATTGTGELL